MADQKISQLAAAAVFTGAELIELVQAGANVKSAISALMTVVPTLYVVAPSGAPYATVTAALAAINAGSAPTATTPAVIYVMPGQYVSSSPYVLPQYVSVVGALPKSVFGATFINNTTSVFQCSGFNTFDGLTFLQGTIGNTFCIDTNNNTDIGVSRCAQYGSSGQQQGFLIANGANWARIAIENCIVNSFQSTGPSINLTNSSGAVRFCDTWLRNCFIDMYHTSGGFTFAVFCSGVQDVRIEATCTLRGNTGFTGVYLAKGSVSGTPQVECRHLYTGGGATGVFCEAGTIINLLNSDCAGSGSPAGTIVNHNSYTGATYNALSI